MSDTITPKALLGEAFLQAIREAVMDGIRVATASNGETEGDRLLDADEAAKLLAVSADWLYRNAKKLPFTRKLGPKMLRFSALGIQKYISSRKVD
jgi:predicted DNA-binding transcriptional regulator AlpA